MSTCFAALEVLLIATQLVLRLRHIQRKQPGICMSSLCSLRAQSLIKAGNSSSTESVGVHTNRQDSPFSWAVLAVFGYYTPVQYRG